MIGQDLQSAFAALRASHKAVVVSEPIHWRYEAAAILWELQHGPAVLFDDIVGYEIPLVGNMLNTRDKLASTLGIEAEALQEHVLAAMDSGVPPAVVADAACQARVRTVGLDVLAELPLPQISESDGGRYISAGILICRDPVTGRQNMAICRMQAKEAGKLGVYMAPTHSAQFLDTHRRLGQRMEIAVAIGCHPAVTVASQMLVPCDEMEIAGGLLGIPLRVAHARTVDLVVPAEAEIVLEGWVDPSELGEEGPFGEFPGTYAPVRHNPVIHLSAITTREHPWLQMIVGGRHPEHLITGAIAREAGLLRSVRAAVPGTRQVVLTEGGNCRFHAVISIDQRVPGEARLAATVALSSQDLIKYVVVVDEDIDPADKEQVEWALATRMRAHEDLIVLPGMKSNPVDPMSLDRTITKLGIDATVPVSTPTETRRQRVGVPASVRDDIRRRWSGLVSLPSEQEGLV